MKVQKSAEGKWNVVFGTKLVYAAATREQARNIVKRFQEI